MRNIHWMRMVLSPSNRKCVAGTINKHLTFFIILKMREKRKATVTSSQCSALCLQ